MADPFHPDDLRSATNVIRASHLYHALADLVVQTHPITAVTALACLFANVCIDADVDADATLSQMQEMLERGDFRTITNPHFISQPANG